MSVRRLAPEAVDVLDGKIQRMTQVYKPGAYKRFALIEPSSAEAIRPKDKLAPVRMGSVPCDDCRHRPCQACEECSVAKQYSDFWICHCCGELNRRVRDLDVKGVA